MRQVPGEAWFGLAAALLCAVALLFFWPGVAPYDGVAQYQQVVSGSYYDWHPPAMARLWSLFHAAGWTGQAPMFVLQVLLYWAGLGLLAAALARSGCRIAAGAVIALGLWPPFLGWQAAVLKDGQMAGALLAATGLVAWKRLRREPLGPLVVAMVILLLGYAALVRANAIFAVAPLGVGLLAPWRWREWPVRFATIAAATLAVLALSPMINHGVLGAEASGVEATQPIFDMAGIAHRAGPGAVPLLPAETWRTVEARRCTSSILWDIFSSGQRCGFIQDDLVGLPREAIFSAWTRAIREHPGAYAAHRIAHWNATMRWFVPWHFPLAAPLAGSEPNDLGLRSPAPGVEAYDGFAGWLANGPFGAPILAFAAALAVLALARPERGPVQGLAVALALSAAAIELSFLVVSISSDWRYHLWAMIAAWLSVILVATVPLPPRAARFALAGLALVAVTSLGARLLLPPVGDSYEAAIGAG